MYRVIFRVIQVSINVEQDLKLQLIFKKNKQSIHNNTVYPLKNGKAHIDLTTEFLIDNSDSTFQLHVNFTFNKIKKLVGFILMNLHDWFCNTSYQQIRALQKSPGGKAFIEYNFIYFETGIKSNDRFLLAFQQFQKETKKQYRDKVQKENSTLNKQIIQLDEEKDNLIIQNDIFCKTESIRDAEYEKINAFYDLEKCQIGLQMEQSVDLLKKQQEKTQFLMNLVMNSGQAELISAIKQIQMQQQSEQRKFTQN